MPKVSIIVPFYNVEKYFDKCLDSLRRQTLNDIEFILVDDGSKDSSADIAKKYLADSRFTLHSKTNGGLSDARNFGMKRAKGEYIAFVDSDDYVEPDMYKTMFAKAAEEKADLVECDFIWGYAEKNIIDKTKVGDNVLADIRVMAWNKLYRKELIDRLGLMFTVGVRYEDTNWCYKIVPYINRLASVKKPFYHYIQRSGSISNTQNEKVRDIFIILDNTLDYYREKGIYEKYRVELEYLYSRFLLGSSFVRTLGIRDKKLRKRILKESWDLLNDKFPQWKKNRILKSKKDKKHMYFKILSRKTYLMSAEIIRLAGLARTKMGRQNE
jgi:glycosyltransferase involved in cell wall biosynthesis